MLFLATGFFFPATSRASPPHARFVAPAGGHSPTIEHLPALLVLERMLCECWPSEPTNPTSRAGMVSSLVGVGEYFYMAFVAHD